MAWYNTGNIALTNGSATVTGSGTNFLVGAQIGEALYAPDGKLYEIQTINSATVITLASNYLGSTATGQSYQIIPTQSLVADLASDVTDLISDFANVRDYAGNGKFNDGAVGTPGITFTQDQDNGLYRIGANNWALAAGGQQVVNLTTTAMNFPDNNKAIFGAGSDLQIYSDGTTGQITGNVNVTGNVSADEVISSSIISSSSTNPRLRLFETDTTDLNTQLQNNGGDFFIKTIPDDASTSTTRLAIDHATGDISFYNTAGTSQSLFWDASAESLGIGTSAPITISSAGPTLEVSGTAGGTLVLTDSNATSGARSKYLLSQGGALYFGDSADNGSSPSNNLVIDASGNVGIGTSSITSNTILHMKDTDTQIKLESTNGSNSAFIDFDGTNLQLSTNRNMVDGAFSNTGKSSAGIFLVGQSGGSLIRFATASANNTTPSTRMTLDASGNLLVGGTSTNPTGQNVAGAAIDSSGEGNFSVNGAEALRLNRKTSDGTIVSFMKDGTTVGSIASSGGDSLIIQGIATGSGLAFHNSAAILPIRNGVAVDNLIDLGRSAQRFSDAYVTNGVTTGSDGNYKQDIEELNAAETAVAIACKGLLRKWRWKDAVEAKGDDARIHFGIIAQDLQAAFEAEGLDAGRYAMFMSNTWVDEETGEERTRLGVRYHELLAFIIAAI